MSTTTSQNPSGHSGESGSAIVNLKLGRFQFSLDSLAMEGSKLSETKISCHVKDEKGGADLQLLQGLRGGSFWMNLDLILAMVSAAGSAGLPLYLWKSHRNVMAKYNSEVASR